MLKTPYAVWLQLFNGACMFDGHAGKRGGIYARCVRKQDEMTPLINFRLAVTGMPLECLRQLQSRTTAIWGLVLLM